MKTIALWKKTALKNLKIEVGNSDLRFAHYDNDSDDHFSAVSQNADYTVFKDEQSATDHATNYVLDMLENEPETFTQNWLQQFVYVTDTDRRIIAGEEAEYILDGRSDEEIIEMADMDIDEYNDAESDTDKEVIVDSAREIVRQREYDKWYEGLSDPIDFLVNEQGLYSEEDAFKCNFISINTREASEDAVSTDGVAHFLSSYDGREIELDNGVVAYRTN